MGTKEIASAIRQSIKNDKELAECKWSVTTEYYSGGSSIHVTMTEAPFEAFTDKFKRENKYMNTQHAFSETDITPRAIRLMNKVREITRSYQYDDSDPMTDYHCRNFYDWYYIGRYDKPFKVCASKPTSKPTASAQATTSTKVVLEGKLRLFNYSDKAIALVGDTKPIKDILKNLGGRFNSHLSCGAGWIFSKKAEGKLRAALVGAC
ncbi:MAG: LPD29 domain-containing protein [Ruminococcus sp.]|uniref:LPD29 domain-containing protein n=1 Tax=Ruminococcus sp. TaxID=41978 RepID=UPI003F071ED8